MNYKLKALLVFLILMLSVGMVSASESVSVDSHVNDGNEQLAIQVTDVDVVSADVGTFTELDNMIKDSENGVINLEKDYRFDSSKDSYTLKDGIQVDSHVINGNGHTISGSGVARIFNQPSGTVILNNLTIVDAYFAGRVNGGAYLLQSGELIVNDCHFENNHAGRHGGAIAVASITSSSSVEIKNSEFVNNSGVFNGGAIYANKLLVENSVFELNRILTRSTYEYTTVEQKGLGGAIFARDSKIYDSYFEGNRVLNSGNFQIEEGGGAITSIKELTVENSIFKDNTALKGGAIFGIAQFSSDLNPSSFINVINCDFSENVAQSGGAICSNFNITVDQSRFNKNTANGYGGGAINTGFKSNNNIFTNSNFTDNLAYNYGGALSVGHSHINNCLFDNNEANHGGAIFALSSDLTNSKFNKNTGTLGNETIVVIDGLTKDKNTKIPSKEIKTLDSNKVNDYSKDVLDGNPARTKYIPSGKYAGYEVYCIEHHLFYPDDTEGVIVKDLTYISNSIDRTAVGEYVRLLFYLREAYPERYTSYTLDDVQDIIWLFTDGDYQHSDDKLVNDILDAYDNGLSKIFNETTYVLPNGTLMEYNMEIFLTPTDRQNMVLFKSQPYVPTYNETVKKDTLNDNVLVGEDVEFRITVTNTGNQVLEDVFVKDTDYSKGLVYKGWRNDKGKWTFKGKGLWVLNYDLEPEEEASLIVIFSTKVLGNLTNNVTSGYKNITLSNSTNKTTTLSNPELAVEKISENVKSNYGDEVCFTIRVTNVGKFDCTGVYVVDNKYSKGLKYDYYVDPSNSWKYNGKLRWDYDGVLKVGEHTDLLLFFLVTTKNTGLLNNTVFVGNNVTDKIVNCTNSTNVTKPIINDTPDQPEDENDTNKTHKVFKHHRVDRNATGNPLFALILVLISLGVITSRRK